MRADPEQTIATERLLLEPLVPAHAPALTRFAKLWDVARYTASIPHPYPAGCAEKFAKRAVERRGGGDGWVFAVVSPDGGGVLGVADITLSDDRRAGELGYAYAPEAWGNGYATEVARALVRFGFERLRLDRIEAHAMMENAASRRVLAKAGLRRVGERAMPAPARGRDILCETYRMFWTERLA